MLFTSQSWVLILPTLLSWYASYLVCGNVILVSSLWCKLFVREEIFNLGMCGMNYLHCTECYLWSLLLLSSLVVVAIVRVSFTFMVKLAALCSALLLQTLLLSWLSILLQTLLAAYQVCCVIRLTLKLLPVSVYRYVNRAGPSFLLFLVFFFSGRLIFNYLCVAGLCVLWIVLASYVVRGNILYSTMTLALWIIIDWIAQMVFCSSHTRWWLSSNNTHANDTNVCALEREHK